jgi:general secretion pathway protein M
MSALGSATSSPAVASLRQQAGTWWQARTARERQAIALVLLVVVAFILWSLLIQPALDVVRKAPAQLDQLDAQLQQMQGIATESVALRAAPRVAPGQAAQALKGATDRLGDRGKIVLLGDRATLTLTNVTPEALRAWLGEARSGARARPVEAQLQRGPLGYSGTIGVALGGNP